MKKKATARNAMAARRQTSLNFPTNSDADILAETVAAVSSPPDSGSKRRSNRTADFTDGTDNRHSSEFDSPALSAVTTSAPTERKAIAQGKKRIAAALGNESQIENSPDWATDPSLPKSWEWGTMGKVLASIDTGKSFRCEERPPKDLEIGVIKVSAVTWGTYNETESKTCVDASRINEHYYVQLGDFLFSRANTIQLIGACVIADGRCHSHVRLGSYIMAIAMHTVANRNEG